MNEPVWTFEHSVECTANRNFAWAYWTNIANWNDPPAKFELDGPFAVGSRLTTTLPEQTMHSVISSIDPGCAATIEMQLPDAILSFHWRFEELHEDQTLISKRLVLSGPKAKSFVAQVSTMEVSVPEGMMKVVAAIERAHIDYGEKEVRRD